MIYPGEFVLGKTQCILKSFKMSKVLLGFPPFPDVEGV
jgi:hypothetical protein